MYPKKSNPEIVLAKRMASEEKRYILLQIHLHNLFRRKLLDIASRANAKKAADSQRSVPTVTRENEPEAVETNIDAAIDPLHGSAHDGSGIPLVASVPISYEWARLDAFAKLMLEKDIAREHDERRSVQGKVRKDLDRQMADINERKYRERIEDMEFSQLQAQEVQRWAKEEKIKADERRRRAELEKADRDEQLKYDAERKHNYEMKQKEEEMRQANLIESDIKKTKDDAALKKQKERIQTKHLMEENERDRLAKLEVKKRNAAEELRQLQDYHDLLEKQEKEREAELARRIERQKMLIKRMEEGVMKAIHAKSNDDNIRALKQQAEMDARAIEIDRFKKEKLSKLQEDMREALQNQISEKEARKREEEDLRKVHAQILQNDTASFEQSEAAHIQSRRRRLRQHQTDLRKQVELALQKRKMDQNELNKDEILINRELIELVESTLA